MHENSVEFEKLNKKYICYDFQILQESDIRFVRKQFEKINFFYYNDK